MSDLTFNKIAAGVLATGLLIFGLKEVSAMVFEPDHAEKPGYFVEVVEAADPGAPAAEVPPDWGTVLPIADLAAGEASFKKCTSCHKLTAENAIGPGLVNVVGRRPASHPGFAFSDALIAYAGENPQWQFANLDAFLKNPKGVVNGTKMTFAGIKQQQERINLIAYLHSTGSSLPIPAPNPAAAAPVEPAEGAATEADEPTATGETAQAGQPAQAPTTGPAAAPTQTTVPKGKAEAH